MQLMNWNTGSWAVHVCFLRNIVNQGPVQNLIIQTTKLMEYAKRKCDILE